jgi:porphobilinogen deaminase
MPDGSRSIRETVSGAAAEAEQLGELLANKLLELGAAELLEAVGAAHA